MSWHRRKEDSLERVRKQKQSKLDKDIKRNHIETKKYSRRSNSSKTRGTCLEYYGVKSHLDRQFKAQKEKELVAQLMSTGAHRNVKRRKKSRVTIPKKSRHRKYLKEAITTINHHRVQSSANNPVTSEALSIEGFTLDQIVETAHDLENHSRERMKSQFIGDQDIKFEQETRYSSAVDTLHKYLHSFHL